MLNARRERAWQLGLGAAGILTVLTLWQLIGSRMNPLLLPTPAAIISAVPATLDDGLLTEYVSSMSTFVMAFTFATLVGIVLGLLTGLNQTFRWVIDPFATALYSTPGIVLIPLLVLWAGIGAGPKFVLVVLTSVFPVLMNTQLGAKIMSTSQLELARAFGATGFETIKNFVLPGAMPYVMTGIRIAAPRAFVALIAGEVLVTVQGLGGLVVTYSTFQRTAYYFVPLLLIVASSLVIMSLVRYGERRMGAWRIA